MQNIRYGQVQRALLRSPRKNFNCLLSIDFFVAQPMYMYGYEQHKDSCSPKLGTFKLTKALSLSLGTRRISVRPTPPFRYNDQVTRSPLLLLIYPVIPPRLA